MSREAALHSVSTGSLRSYSSALQSYLSFCNSHKLSIEPTPDTLRYYIIYQSFYIQPKSVLSYLSGIVNFLEPYYPDVRKSRQHPLVVRTIKGCMKMKNKPTNRKDPLSSSDIISVHQSISTSTSYDNILFVTLLTVGFITLQRLGELVVPDRTQHREIRKQPLRHTVQISDESISYILPYNKADTFFDGNRILIPKHPIIHNIDSYSIMRRYLHARDSSFPFFPELWVRSNGQPPTRSWFLQLLLHQFPNYHNLGGHSIRSGGATALALAGIPDSRIQSIGRWASDTFRVYIRKHPLLLDALIRSKSH